MLASLEDLLSLVDRIYADPGRLPKPFRVLRGLRRVQAGESLAVVARESGTTSRRLEAVSRSDDPVMAVLHADLAASRMEPGLGRARALLGQLLLGVLAERAFEKIYKTTMGTTELVLEDDRSSRSDTDFRVLNGERRRVFRINIKYHGSPFRRAQELVGLEPEDCFALATYKIHLAIKKQEAESLPYVFVVVGVPSMTGEQVGQAFPEDLTQLTRLIQLSNVSGKRDVEDDVVRFLLGTKAEETSAIAGFAKRIGEAPWRVLSARRADLLLRKLLFDRVYAVRVRGFARNYRNAELDMHFSLKQDLTPLEEFLVLLKEHGLHGLSVRLERGSV